MTMEVRTETFGSVGSYAVVLVCHERAMWMIQVVSMQSPEGQLSAPEARALSAMLQEAATYIQASVVRP